VYEEPSDIARESGLSVGIDADTMPMFNSLAVQIVILTESQRESLYWP
jgi:hypothetical protein